jgi:hypothetical protein
LPLSFIVMFPSDELNLIVPDQLSASLRVISPCPVISGGPAQTVFQVTRDPSFLKSELLHLRESSIATGGSFHSLAAHTLTV